MKIAITIMAVGIVLCFGAVGIMLVLRASGSGGANEPAPSWYHRAGGFGHREGKAAADRLVAAGVR